MGPFDLVKNARSCDVNFKEEEKLSEKYVLSIGSSELVITVSSAFACSFGYFLIC